MHQGWAHLLLGGCLLHTLAEGLRAGEAGGAGQTVVARVCVLTPVHTVELKASVRHFFAL